MIALSAACGGGADSPASHLASAQWIGQTYELTIHNGLDGGMNDWREPTPDLGAKISGPVIPQFLMGVGAGPAGELTVTLGTARADAQDACTGTVQTTFSGSAYPDATIGPVDFPMHLVDPRSGRSVETTIHGVTFRNVLPGSTSTGMDDARGTFDATIDVREIYSLVTAIPNPTQESVCATLSSFMVPCQPCPFDGQPYCLPVEAVALQATGAPGAVRTIGASDIPATCDN